MSALRFSSSKRASQSDKPDGGSSSSNKTGAIGGMLSFLENRLGKDYEVTEDLTLELLLQHLSNQKTKTTQILTKPRRGGSPTMEKDEFFKLVVQLLKACPMWNAKVVRADVDGIFDALDRPKTGKLEVVEVRRVLQPWKKENANAAAHPTTGKGKQEASKRPGGKSLPKKTARVAPMAPDEEEEEPDDGARASRWSQNTIEDE